MEQFSVYPHGLSLGQGTFRPAMIFKDKRESEVLPIWLDPMETNILLASSQVNTQADAHSSSAHRASLKIFEAADLELESIYFNEVSNSTQYAQLSVRQGKKRIVVRVRASEVMSLALNSGCPFFTDRDIVEKSRTLNFQYALHQGENRHSDRVSKKDMEVLH